MMLNSVRTSGESEVRTWAGILVKDYPERNKEIRRALATEIIALSKRDEN